MGEIRPFGSEKLIFGILFCEEKQLVQVKELLEAEFGEIDGESPVSDFVYTDYYNPEMGNAIKRCFVSFETLVQPDQLAGIKIRSNGLEENFLADSSRMVNLDPGLLNLSRLILASTKNNAHRVPLSDGIYAEITLLYRKGGFVSLPWTYPDFRSGDYDSSFLAFREKFSFQLKHLKQQ
jgi:hypothetical protein